MTIHTQIMQIKVTEHTKKKISKYLAKNAKKEKILSKLVK